MINLTDVLTNTNTRVTALENSDLADKSGVARIVKNYAGLTVTVVTRIRKRTSLTPSLSLYPGDTVFDQIEVGS